MERDEAMAKALADKDRATFIYIHDRGYRLDALLEIEEQLSDQEFWALARNIWIESWNNYQDLEEWEVLFQSRSGREMMMTDEERAALAALPEPITVYRGCTMDFNENGLAWTTDLVKATWFANHQAAVARGAIQGEERFGMVTEGLVRHHQVVAYFLSRDESEIVVEAPDLVGWVRWIYT